MTTVEDFLREQGTYSPERAEIVFRMSQEIRGEINGLSAVQSGPVAARPGKYETQRRQARIDGMRYMLALAAGLPLASHYDVIPAFLERFREERLAFAKKVTEESRAAQSR
jgi:hypothetical protein